MKTPTYFSSIHLWALPFVRYKGDAQFRGDFQFNVLNNVHLFVFLLLQALEHRKKCDCPALPEIDPRIAFNKQVPLLLKMAEQEKSKAKGDKQESEITVVQSGLNIDGCVCPAADSAM